MATLKENLHAAFHEPNTRIYRIVQGLVWALIVLSIALLVVEAIVPDESNARRILDQVDRAVLTLFALELFLTWQTARLWSDEDLMMRTALIDHPNSLRAQQYVANQQMSRSIIRRFL